MFPCSAEISPCRPLNLSPKRHDFPRQVEGRQHPIAPKQRLVVHGARLSADLPGHWTASASLPPELHPLQHGAAPDFHHRTARARDPLTRLGVICKPSLLGDHAQLEVAKPLADDAIGAAYPDLLTDHGTSGDPRRIGHAPEAGALRERISATAGAQSRLETVGHRGLRRDQHSFVAGHQLRGCRLRRRRLPGRQPIALVWRLGRGSCQRSHGRER